jgi:hypothetical protein
MGALSNEILTNNLLHTKTPVLLSPKKRCGYIVFALHSALIPHESPRKQFNAWLLPQLSSEEFQGMSIGNVETELAYNVMPVK